MMAKLNLWLLPSVRLKRREFSRPADRRRMYAPFVFGEAEPPPLPYGSDPGVLFGPESGGFTSVSVLW